MFVRMKIKSTYPIGFVLSFPSLYHGNINSLPSLFNEILIGLFNIEPKDKIPMNIQWMNIVFYLLNL